MLDSLRTLLSADELWVGAALTVSVLLGLALARHPSPALALAGGIVAASIVTATASLASVVLIAGSTFVPKLRERPAPVLVSVGAAFSVYVCVPDTERALLVLGAVAALAVATLVRRWRWDLSVAWTETIALMWVALEDGPPRDSARIASLAIALMHLVACARPSGRDPVVQGVTIVVMLWLARVAGMGTGTQRPVLLAALATTAVLGTMVWRGRPSPSR